MTKIKNSCGCVADSGKWLELCKEHEALHNWHVQESSLGSLWNLIVYYNRYPTADNLKHVVARIKIHGSLVAKHPQVVTWIKSHRELLTSNRAG